ncbi:hypothetical protein SERLA73DRAFT_149234 [Serpula lacrymans var. lacrymans S7.3]|uniref:Uncharacterized protein n=1 Tax=Serpula lacrymans var. lacrymans (strain S7.3) TaxID=936435 RepID=F8PGU7_SERL3|nr:hypothetical protein SERLA73DRAFT_149234 [Serpula lacrymans var. lacrymans S7.3]
MDGPRGGPLLQQYDEALYTCGLIKGKIFTHGFFLLIADMVQSGELAKYPLAVVEKLLDSFGDGLARGFNINCKFKTTLSRSLTMFLYNNYKQALDILVTGPINLACNAKTQFQ